MLHDLPAPSAVTLAELGQLAIWHHDLQSQRLFYNALGWALLGLAPRPEGITLDEARSLIHPDDLPAVLQSYAQSLSSGGITETLARYRHADGQWRHIQLRRSVQCDAQGQVLGFVGVARDVSADVRGSEHSAALQRRLELTADALGLGFWRHDLGSGELGWNAQMYALYDLPAQRPPRQADWLRRVHPDDRARVEGEFASLLRQPGQLREIEYRVLHRDGRLRWLVDRARMDPAAQALSGVLLDISERRAAEEALAVARDRALLSTRGAGLATWEYDMRSGQVSWDEQMYLLRGLPPQALPPSEAEVVALVHPEDRARVKTVFDSTRHSSQISGHEFRVRLPDGSYRWLASRSSVVQDAQGRAIKRIGLNWDISATKRQAEAEQQRELALKASQAKSEFLARVSHELRTPLNAVLGFTQLLQAEGGMADAAAAQRRLRHIRAAGEHLLALINDVLDISRLEAGDLRMQAQPVDLAQLCAETLPLLEGLAQDRRVQLECCRIEGLALGDATRLRQVLINLLSNAIKYNRPGGRVSISAWPQQGQLRLSVSDSGRGLSEAQLGTLFQPFNRLGREHEAIEGTGIGLAIVKALIEGMGGQVIVSSTPGLGSTFELLLAQASDVSPVSPEPSAALPASTDAASPTTTVGRLLYIEDNPVNQLVVQELVARRPQLQLECAENGGEGVARARSLRPDLVLVDMQLPDFDGYEVLRRLRADASTAAIPCIALSANAMPEDISRALRAGFADYWTKPIDFKAFLGGLDALFAPRP